MIDITSHLIHGFEQDNVSSDIEISKIHTDDVIDKTDYDTPTDKGRVDTNFAFVYDVYKKVNGLHRVISDTSVNGEAGTADNMLVIGAEIDSLNDIAMHLDTENIELNLSLDSKRLENNDVNANRHMTRILQDCMQILETELSKIDNLSENEDVYIEVMKSGNENAVTLSINIQDLYPCIQIVWDVDENEELFRDCHVNSKDDFVSKPKEKLKLYTGLRSINSIDEDKIENEYYSKREKSCTNRKLNQSCHGSYCDSFNNTDKCECLYKSNNKSSDKFTFEERVATCTGAGDRLKLDNQEGSKKYGKVFGFDDSYVSASSIGNDEFVDAFDNFLVSVLEYESNSNEPFGSSSNINNRNMESVQREENLGPSPYNHIYTDGLQEMMIDKTKMNADLLSNLFDENHYIWSIKSKIEEIEDWEEMMTSSSSPAFQSVRNVIESIDRWLSFQGEETGAYKKWLL